MKDFLKITMLALSIVAPAVQAQQVGHEPLRISESLTFDEVFRRALTHTPEMMEASVREAEVRHYSDRSDSWLSGRPSVQVNYFSDGLLADDGARELEYSIQMPLWRPGERRSSLGLADSHELHYQAWQEYLRHMVAGRVRMVLADIAEAEATLALVEQSLVDADTLLDMTSRLFEAGEVARRDLMQARSMRLTISRERLNAEAGLVDAERDYEVLTGLKVRPAGVHREQLSERETLQPDHPVLRYLQTRIDIQSDTVAQVQRDARGSPTLSIGSRHERSDRFTPYTDVISLSFSMPIGGSSHVDARTSSARRALVDAEVAWHNRYRELERNLHEVEHQLFLTRESVQLMEQEVALARESWQLALLAYEQGELNMAQVMPSLQQFRDSERDLRILQLETQRLIQDYNQTIGVLP